eukprot:scaffold35718_cov135-Isochrysis_galbana.AAC.2
MRASALGEASIRGAAGAGGAVDVEALLAVAAEFPRPGECAADGLGSPLVFFLTGAPGFGVEAGAH